MGWWNPPVPDLIIKRANYTWKQPSKIYPSDKGYLDPLDDSFTVYTCPSWRLTILSQQLVMKEDLPASWRLAAKETNCRQATTTRAILAKLLKMVLASAHAKENGDKYCESCKGATWQFLGLESKGMQYERARLVHTCTNASLPWSYVCSHWMFGWILKINDQVAQVI